jgi:GntR family transcriptional regulator
MSKIAVTTAEIQQAVFRRIMRRQYRVGDRLPSVRDLAKELGANRNTVNRAYQLLANMGVVEISKAARGGFYVKHVRANSQSQNELKDYFYRQLLNLVWQGFAAGLSSEEVSEHFKGALEQVFDMGNLTIAFFECNVQDSKDMGRYLGEVLHRDIYCGLLGELEQDADEIASNYDLIITTFHHLSSVMQTLNKYADKVVGVDTRLTPDTLLEIARLPKGRMGVVSTLPSTARMLQHILYSYYPDWSVEAIAMDDKKAVKNLSRRCDHLLVTHTCIEEVKALTKRVPDVVLHFQVDQQSIQFLDKRIRDMQVQKTEAIQNVSVPKTFQTNHPQIN